MPAFGFPLICLVGAVVAGPAPPPRSGSITWLPDGTTLAVANLDADSVTLVATEPLSKLAEIAVGRHPRSVAAGNDGKTLFVSLPETNQLVWVDLERRQKAGRTAGSRRPFRRGCSPIGKQALRGGCLCSPDQRSGHGHSKRSTGSCPWRQHLGVYRFHLTADVFTSCTSSPAS